MSTARTAGDAQSALPQAAEATKIVAELARAVKDAVNRAGDIAIINARAGLGNPSPADRAAYGDIAESALARAVVERFGHEILHLNTKPGEKGIDLVSYDESTSSLVVWEVKSSLTDGSIDKSPQMGRTNDGKQMGTSWLDARLANAGLDVAKASDVETRAVRIDLKSGKAQVWTVEPATGAKGRLDTPFDIDDLLDLQG